MPHKPSSVAAVPAVPPVPAPGPDMFMPGTTTAAEPPRPRAATPRDPRRHIPALDGVRGLAVALVMAFHFTENATPLTRFDTVVLHSVWTGWIGVDFFFVLSGFLITGILLDTRDGVGYFRNFYVRRTLRIFPLYYAILVATLLISPLVQPGVRDGNWFNVIADQAPWLWTYTSNIYLSIHDTWDVAGIFGHFWSLAVEEQFYVVWPAIVWLCPPRTLQRVCVAIAFAAVAVRIGLLSMDNSLGGFMLMPARADSLAIGAWLAAGLRAGVPIARLRHLSRFVLAAAAIAFADLFVRRHPLRPEEAEVQVIGFSLLALAAAALIALALDDGNGPTTFGRVFRHPTLRFLGKYSYAMYCLHPLVMEALQRNGLGFTVHAVPEVAGSALPGALLYGAVAFGLTTVGAVATWHLLEKHFLRLKDRFARLPTVEAQPEPPARVA